MKLLYHLILIWQEGKSVEKIGTKAILNFFAGRKIHISPRIRNLCLDFAVA